MVKKEIAGKIMRTKEKKEVLLEEYFDMLLIASDKELKSVKVRKEDMITVEDFCKAFRIMNEGLIHLTRKET